MQWYHRIIFLLGQMLSCNTPKGTWKSSFHVEYKSVSFEMANDAQNGIFKISLLPWGQVSDRSECCWGNQLGFYNISYRFLHLLLHFSWDVLVLSSKEQNKGLLDFPLGQIPSTPGYSDVLKAMEETYSKICLRTSLCHMRLPHLFHGLFSWWEDRRTSGSPQGQMFAVSLCSGYRHSTELRESHCLPSCSSYRGKPHQAIMRSTVSFHS